jgi:hypothetical protein
MPYFFRLLLCTFFIALFIAQCCAAQTTATFGAGADTAVSVRWGTGQDFGRMRFPANVLGLPDTAARADRPSASPQQVCSLGMGGEIVLAWRNAVLVNRPGADFTIFENAFTRFDGRVFAEPATVAVSRDGVRFVAFPFDSLTLRGCAGRTPTNGNASPFNAALSGGDSFDLAEIGMDSVRFIKISDISAFVLSNTQHPFWDPTITGFDLDAVVGLSLLPAPFLQRVPTNVVGQISETKTSHAVKVDIENDILTIENAFESQFVTTTTMPTMTCELYTLPGERVHSSTFVGAFERWHRVSLHSLARGAYFLILRSNNHATNHTTTFPILLQ